MFNDLPVKSQHQKVLHRGNGNQRPDALYQKILGLMPLKTHQAIPEAQIQTQGRKNGPEGR